MNRFLSMWAATFALLVALAVPASANFAWGEKSYDFNGNAVCDGGVHCCYEGSGDCPSDYGITDYCTKPLFLCAEGACHLPNAAATVRAPAPTIVPTDACECQTAGSCVCTCKGECLCTVSKVASYRDHTATRLTGDLTIGKGLVDLAPLRGPNTATAIMGELNLQLNNAIGPVSLSAGIREPFYDGYYWKRAFGKFTAGFTLPLTHNSEMFGSYERGTHGGLEWGWLGYRLKFGA